jgi:hypothetical protein
MTDVIGYAALPSPRSGWRSAGLSTNGNAGRMLRGAPARIICDDLKLLKVRLWLAKGDLISAVFGQISSF